MSVSITNTVHTAVTVRAYNLTYAAGDYDYFVYEFSQNGETILTFTSAKPSGSAKDFSMRFNNPEYLGNNYFAPATSYAVEVIAYYNGSGNSAGTADFTTGSISPPSGTIGPVSWPRVRNQGEYGMCTAMAAVTAMELLKNKAKNQYSGSYEEYSATYFFGSDGREDNNMVVKQAMELMRTSGAPRWELVETNRRRGSKSTSRSVYQNACSLARANAQKQCITGYENIDFYDCASVANAIRNNGCFIFSFRLPKNFRDKGETLSNGIVDQPDEWYKDENGEYVGHTMVLIGLTAKKINGVSTPCWIAQNSWGTNFGDIEHPGFCYVPYNWGCGVQSPQPSDNTTGVCGWTMDCYAPIDNSVPTNHPAAPTVTSAVRSEDGKTATVSFTKGTSDSVLIYDREKNSSYWFPKSADGGTDYGVTSTSPVVITLDSADAEYEVSAIAVNSENLLSLRSAVKAVAEKGAGAKCYIFSSGSWKPATPYVFSGGRWAEATAKIYNGGWQP